MLAAAHPNRDDALSLSDCLVKCSGQDICRRGKSRNIMVVLPAEFSFVKGAEGKLGYIENFDTPKPVFVVETDEGEIRYHGRFVDMSTVFLSIDLQPRKSQSTCTDITSRALVFDQESSFTKSEAAVAQTTLLTTSTPADAADGTGAPSTWTTHFGCSQEAHPDSVRVTAAMMGRNGMIRQKAGALAAGDGSQDDDNEDEETAWDSISEEDNYRLSQTSNSRRKSISAPVSDKKSRRSAQVTDDSRCRRSVRNSSSSRQVSYAEDSVSEVDEEGTEMSQGESSTEGNSSASEFEVAKKRNGAVDTTKMSLTSKPQTVKRRTTTTTKTPQKKKNSRQSSGKDANSPVLLSDSDDDAGSAADKSASKAKSTTKKKYGVVPKVTARTTKTTSAASKRKRAAQEIGDGSDDEYAEEHSQNRSELKVSGGSVRASARKQSRISYAEDTSSTEEESNDDDDDDEWGSD